MTPAAPGAIRMTAYAIREAYDYGELGAGDEFVDAPAHDAQVDAGMKLVEQNEKLRHALETCSKGHERTRIAELEASLAQATARLAELAALKPHTMRQRVEELERALRRYGHHDLGKCEFMKHSSRSCTCGFDAVCAALAGEGAE